LSGGRLLTELREEYKKDENNELSRVEPLLIKDFLLYGEPIGIVTRSLERMNTKAQWGLFG